MESKTVSKNQKILILESYRKKIITKDEMNFLLKSGLSVPHIMWSENSSNLSEYHRKRDLIEKVTGQTFPKITWIATNKDDNI